MKSDIQDTRVESGRVAVCRARGVLRAGAIGSCVVVVACDCKVRVGGMAHVMLPGAFHRGGLLEKTSYARNAVEKMRERMAALGAEVQRIRVCLVGGANVLGDGHDSPGASVVESLTSILDEAGMVVVAREVGGTRRRSCLLDMARGTVSYTTADSAPSVLMRMWRVKEPRGPADPDEETSLG